MNREARITPIPQRVLGSLSLKCPRCDANGTFDYRGNVMWIVQGVPMEYSLWSCPNPECNIIVYVTTDEQGTILDTYPKRVPKIEQAVPSSVRSDMEEAYKSFNAGAWRASAAVGRRALQSSLLELKATKGKLQDQIDEVYAKTMITKEIRDWAHEIRLIGNDGAHPDKDGLQDVTEDDAKELLEFLEKYTDYVYIMPAKVAASRKKRDEAEAERQGIREKKKTNAERYV